MKIIINRRKIKTYEKDTYEHNARIYKFKKKNHSKTRGLGLLYISA